QDRQRVIEPDQLHQDRRAAERLDEDQRDRAYRAETGEAAEGSDEPADEPAHHDDHGEADGDTEPVEEEPAIAPEYAEVPLIHACLTLGVCETVPAKRQAHPTSPPFGNVIPG